MAVVVIICMRISAIFFQQYAQKLRSTLYNLFLKRTLYLKFYNVQCKLINNFFLLCDLVSYLKVLWENRFTLQRSRLEQHKMSEAKNQTSPFFVVYLVNICYKPLSLVLITDYHLDNITSDNTVFKNIYLALIIYLTSCKCISNIKHKNFFAFLLPKVNLH